LPTVIASRDLRAPTRRQLLAGTLLLALAACAEGNATDSGYSPGDGALRRQAAADEQRLLAAYAATAARHPDLASRLAVPWQQHREHAARLAGSTRASAGMSGAPSATPSVPAVPASAVAAERALATLERAVAAARLQACGAAGRQLAPLLGSLAAAELVHADVLLAGGLDTGGPNGGGLDRGALDTGPA
jgi:hypothetical protein